LFSSEGENLAAGNGLRGYFTLFSEDILDNTALSTLTAITEGYSGADLKNLLRQAKLNKALTHATTGQLVPITVQDLCHYATAMRRS
jgi:SpoVK/Ycf46/Vps4 family AAA+-type ATPase